MFSNLYCTNLQQLKKMKLEMRSPFRCVYYNQIELYFEYFKAYMIMSAIKLYLLVQTITTYFLWDIL